MFGDKKYWFIHRSGNINSNSFVKTFKHIQIRIVKAQRIVTCKAIPLCINLEKGLCIFSNENFWLNHDDNIKKNESENENKDVVQIIFSLMQKMTERIVKMEMNNQKKCNIRK